MVKGGDSIVELDEHTDRCAMAILAIYFLADLGEELLDAGSVMVVNWYGYLYAVLEFR